MPYIKLSTPPIIESVFLVRFKENLSKEQIESFCNDKIISSRYAEKDSGDSRKKAGTYLLRSNEANRAVRVNIDSLSLHYLTYSPFEEIYEEFKGLIELVTSVADSLTIDVINLRYVNTIKVNEQEGRFKVHDYLTFKIETPFTIGNFFLQILVENEKDEDMQGIIIGALREPKDSSEENTPSLLLDINVQKKVDIKSTEEDTLRNVLFMMRDFKNWLFFETVQPSVLETYA